MTIDDRVEQFLAENPHFVKPMGPFGGSGASDTLSGQMYLQLQPAGIYGAALREEKRQHAQARDKAHVKC